MPLIRKNLQGSVKQENMNVTAINPKTPPRIIFILRTPEGTSKDTTKKIIDATFDSGAQAVEITANSEHWVAVLQSNKGRCLGAGTILDKGTAEVALDNGAQFLVSPILDKEVVGFAREKGVFFLPGVLEICEAEEAKELGIEFVKVFPSNATTSEQLLHSLEGPFKKEIEKLRRDGWKLVVRDHKKGQNTNTPLIGTRTSFSSPNVFYRKFLELQWVDGQRKENGEEELEKELPIAAVLYKIEPVGLARVQKISELGLCPYPTGGMTKNTLEKLPGYGAYGACVGSSVFPDEAIKSCDLDEIRKRVSEVVQEAEIVFN